METVLTTANSALDQWGLQLVSCDLCPRMTGRTRVPGAGNSIAQGLLAIGEAPGRLGADRTGIPFEGDRSAANFNRLLGAAGIDRGSLFVANAVSCNPRTSDGRNDRPAAAEIRNCSRHLERLIAILDPRVIVTLGRVALRALDQIHRHDISLRSDVGIPHVWGGRVIIPLYHPGPRAMIHRPFEKQVADYRAVKHYALTNLTSEQTWLNAPTAGSEQLDEPPAQDRSRTHLSRLANVQRPQA